MFFSPPEGRVEIKLPDEELELELELELDDEELLDELLLDELLEDELELLDELLELLVLPPP